MVFSSVQTLREVALVCTRSNTTHGARAPTSSTGGESFRGLWLADRPTTASGAAPGRENNIFPLAKRFTADRCTHAYNHIAYDELSLSLSRTRTYVYIFCPTLFPSPLIIFSYVSRSQAARAFSTIAQRSASLASSS